eukprot:8037723-Pyramimonas_sp.AAC.1
MGGFSKQPRMGRTEAAYETPMKDKTRSVTFFSRWSLQKAAPYQQVLCVLLFACAAPAAGQGDMEHEVQVEFGTFSRTYTEFNLSVTFSRPSTNFTLGDFYITGADVLAVTPWPPGILDTYRWTPSTLGVVTTHFFSVSAQRSE